ncbi:MAG: tetratricopeptide repeat protein [Pseudomonadota bacterium]
MDNKIVSLLFFLIFFVGIAKHTAQSSIKVADSLYTIGDYSKAIKTYTEITPKSDHILAQMARSHKAKGTYDDALAFYQQAIATNPRALIAQMEYGKLLMTTKSFQKANRIFEGLVAKYPENPGFQYQLGLTKETLKDSSAIYHYRKAFDLDQTHQKSCYKVAKHFLVHREFDSVVKYAKTGLSYYKNNV